MSRYGGRAAALGGMSAGFAARRQKLYDAYFKQLDAYYDDKGFLGGRASMFHEAKYDKAPSHDAYVDAWYDHMKEYNPDFMDENYEYTEEDFMSWLINPVDY